MQTGGVRVWHLSGGEPKAELLHKGVNLLLLGNEAEQVAHDGLELLPRQAGLTGQAGKHVWQQVVDRACALHHLGCEPSYKVAGRMVADQVSGSACSSREELYCEAVPLAR